MDYLSNTAGGHASYLHKTYASLPKGPALATTYLLIRINDILTFKMDGFGGIVLITPIRVSPSLVISLECHHIGSLGFWHGSACRETVKIVSFGPYISTTIPISPG